MEKYTVEEQEKQEEGSGTFYTHAIVSYASLKEIEPLLAQAKHWAYILHDRDKKKDGTLRSPHYHIIATFRYAKSYESVRKLVISDQNTFTKNVLKTIGNVLTYFTHETTNAIKEGKPLYSQEDVVYDNEEYWRKQSLSSGEPWKDEQIKKEISNDEFVNDLLSNNFSAETMGRKYGRDFIKNFRNYLSYRQYVFGERREQAYLSMDGVPNDVEETTGLITSRHAVLSEAEYQLLQELRLNNNTINKKRR